MSGVLNYFLGLDLGQAADFTALTVLEREAVPAELPAGWRPPAYALRYLHRWPLNTPYPAIVSQVVRLLGRPPLLPAPNAPPTILAVDGTGVGRAVVDVLRGALAEAHARNQARLLLVPVVITSGHAVTAGAGIFRHVPKKELVSAMQLLLQGRRLLVPRSLEHAATLVKELENFRIKITAAMKETYEAWREGLHDDLVLATALAAWVGESTLRELVRRAKEAERERAEAPLRIDWPPMARHW